MVDYSAPTGFNGKLIIRDHGLLVQAIVQCNSSQTFANGKAWSVYVGGGSASGLFSIQGIKEVVVWQGNIATTTSMQLNIGATGTTGLGGPSTVNATITRQPSATIPAAPVMFNWDSIGATSASINFTAPASDGGSGIDYYLVRFGVNNPPEAGPYGEFQTVVGRNLRSDLRPGTVYYAVVYAHNAIGYSPPSSVSMVRTLAGARIKLNGVSKLALPFVKVGGIWKMAQPFVRAGGTYKKTG